MLLNVIPAVLIANVCSKGNILNINFCFQSDVSFDSANVTGQLDGVPLPKLPLRIREEAQKEATLDTELPPTIIVGKLTSPPAALK